MSDLYAIIDLENYALKMREAAANSICESNDDNLDEYISLNQMIGLVKQHCKGYDEDDRPLLDEDGNEKIYEDAAIWIHDVGLAKLAAKDLIECAWDNETNEMIFWKKTNEKPPKSRRKNKKNKG